MMDVLILAVIVLIIGSVIWFIRKEKKRGVKCIGCPDAANCASGGCGGNCSGCSGCGNAVHK